MSHLIFRLRGSCRVVMTWTAHQLVTWRISPAGLALAAIVLAVITAPLLYAHQSVLAVLAVALYRLLSVLSGWVSGALGHVDARQRYLRPFMEIILILSVMSGLSLYSPGQLFWPALALVIVVLVFDLERRLAVLLQNAWQCVIKTGKFEYGVDLATGSVGRTLLLMSACYWPQSLAWSGVGFAGGCLVVLAWRLVSNYRLLGRCPETAAPAPVIEQVVSDAPHGQT
ncbi:hypothetical protein M1D97_06660 [Kushneria sp. AK178]